MVAAAPAIRYDAALRNSDEQVTRDCTRLYTSALHLTLMVEKLGPEARAAFAKSQREMASRKAEERKLEQRRRLAGRRSSQGASLMGQLSDAEARRLRGQRHT